MRARTDLFSISAGRASLSRDRAFVVSNGFVMLYANDRQDFCCVVVVVVARDQKQDVPSKVARLRCGSAGFEFPTIAAAHSSDQVEGFRCTHLFLAPFVRRLSPGREKLVPSRSCDFSYLTIFRYFFDATRRDISATIAFVSVSVRPVVSLDALSLGRT